MSVCLSICLSVRLSSSHTFLEVMHSYVSPATHAFLGMLPLCLCCLLSIAAKRDHYVRRLSVCVCVRLSGSHAFLVVMHSYVSQVTHAFLGILPLCSKIELLWKYQSTYLFYWYPSLTVRSCFSVNMQKKPGLAPQAQFGNQRGAKNKRGNTRGGGVMAPVHSLSKVGHVEN